MLTYVATQIPLLARLIYLSAAVGNAYISRRYLSSGIRDMVQSFRVHPIRHFAPRPGNAWKESKGRGAKGLYCAKKSHHCSLGYRRRPSETTVGTRLMNGELNTQ